MAPRRVDDETADANVSLVHIRGEVDRVGPVLEVENIRQRAPIDAEYSEGKVIIEGLEAYLNTEARAHRVADEAAGPRHKIGGVGREYQQSVRG